jgi:hypothetical protein
MPNDKVRTDVESREVLERAESPVASAREDKTHIVQASKQKVYVRDKLSIIPLAVLLPEFGEVNRLHASRARLEMRLEQLQSKTIGAEQTKDEVSEETMLNQAIQWLSLGEKD